MTIEIYYFSGTGNSLAVARDIAKKTNAKLKSISSVIDRESIRIEADSIGVVFPCYFAQLYGIPLVLKRFIKKIEDIKSKYIFAVCTCGGHEIVNALPTLKNLARFIKSSGGHLAAEFSIKLPMNNLDYPSVLINQNQEVMFKKAHARIELICHCVMNNRNNRWKHLKSVFNRLMTPLYKLLQHFYISHLKRVSKVPKGTNLKYYEMIPLSDNSIYADDKCNGCGTCAKICPAKNIHMVANKPEWQHRCEMCLACDEWCPIKAIHHWCKVAGKDYHHPSITISDMLSQRGV